MRRLWSLRSKLHFQPSNENGMVSEITNSTIQIREVCELLTKIKREKSLYEVVKWIYKKEKNYIL